MSCATRLLVVVLLSGCTRKPEAPDAAAPAPVVADQPGTAATPKSELGLFDRLALEKANRDRSDPPTAKVIEALKGAGLEVSGEQQQLGAPHGASHCLGLISASPLIVSVCEYPSAQAAEAGAATSRKTFEAIKHRTVHVRRATTLTLIENPAGPASAAAKQKAVAAFDAL